MSFLEDIATDLDNVFFSEFKNTISVDGGEAVDGYLDKNAHRWQDIELNQSIFTAPASGFPTPRQRGAVITIDGQHAQYIRHFYEGDVIKVVVTHV